MKKFTKESLYEEDINLQMPSAPVTDPEIAQRISRGQAALNKEDMKLQSLTTKMMAINKRKAQIQKAIVKAQRENEKKMQQQAKEDAKGQKLAQDAANKAAEAQAVVPGIPTPLPTSESLLQNEMDELELLEDRIVVLMQAENPDYDKINELLEGRIEYWECPGCGKSIEYGSQEGAGGVCDDCESQGLWVDPAGGVHQGDGDDSYDPASMYENPMSRDKFYDLSEAYEKPDEKKTEENITENYMHFVKVYEDDDWFIGKIFKVDPEDDWYGEVKAGESDNFDNISYEPDYDIIDIVDFLKDTYDKVEVIDELEYNDYVEDPSHKEITEEGGVSGMHL